MTMMKVLLLLYSLLIGYTTAERIVCYYGSWATYRIGNGNCDVSKIDPFKCTHLIYSFAGLNENNRIISLDPYNDLEADGGKGTIKKFNNLRLQNPALKTIVAIGGWNEGSVKYSFMSSTPETRKAFVQSVLDFLQLHNFQGLDLDWEYPGSRGGAEVDKENFIKLLEDLRVEFDKKGYSLSAAVAAGKYTIDSAYKISFLAKYLDFINVMTYDFRGAWEPYTGHHAPLYSRPSDTGESIYYNLNFTIHYYIDQGVPPSKLNLGLPSYAVVWTLANQNTNGLNAPASNVGIAGPYTQQGGFLGYNELCEKMKTQSWTVVRDPYYQVPYAYYGNQWAGYDDVESIKTKTQFAKSLGLGGLMLWSLETEDFLGICGPKFPLLSAIQEVLASSTTTAAPVTTTTTTTTAAPVTTTTTATTAAPVTTTTTATTAAPVTATTTATTAAPATTTTTATTAVPVTTTTTASGETPTDLDAYLKEHCATISYVRHPTNCQIFYQCTKNGNEYVPHKFQCGPGTSFNPETVVCDWNENVEGCH